MWPKLDIKSWLAPISRSWMNIYGYNTMPKDCNESIIVSNSFDELLSISFPYYIRNMYVAHFFLVWRFGIITAIQPLNFGVLEDLLMRYSAKNKHQALLHMIFSKFWAQITPVNTQNQDYHVFKNFIIMLFKILFWGLTYYMWMVEGVKWSVLDKGINVHSRHIPPT